MHHTVSPNPGSRRSRTADPRRIARQQRQILLCLLCAGLVAASAVLALVRGAQPAQGSVDTALAGRWTTQLPPGAAQPRTLHRRHQPVAETAPGTASGGTASVPSGPAAAAVPPEPPAGTVAPRSTTAAPAAPRPAAGSSSSTPAGAVSVTAYGARGDGRSDDAPAIRAALAANRDIRIPAGHYLLRSFQNPRPTRLDADFMFSLRSGQSVTADPGAVLQFADGVIVDSPTSWGGNLFMVDGQSGVTISGGTWDFNGAHNAVRPGQTITGYGVYTYGADTVAVRDVTMENTPGQNYIVMQGRGDHFTVSHSTFRNGGTSLPGNRNQTDFSAMYFTGADVTVDGVHITHDQQPWYYSGGIELHGTHETVTNSVIEKSWPGVYIGPDVTSALPVMNGTAVTGNTFLGVGRAITFNAEGTGSISGVDFSGNTVHTTSFPALGTGRGVDQDAPPDGNWTYHHIISGLVARNNDFYDDDGRTDAGIRLSQIHGGTITQNRFHGLPGEVFELGGSPWGTSDVAFTGNTVGWTGATGAPAIALSFGGYRADRITIAGNTVTRSVTSGAACGVYLDGAAVGAVSVSGNTFGGIGLSTCGPQASSLAFSR